MENLATGQPSGRMFGLRLSLLSPPLPSLNGVFESLEKLRPVARCERGVETTAFPSFT